jgi:hypothetical protein
VPPASAARPVPAYDGPIAPEADSEQKTRLPQLWQVVVMALIAIAFTAAFMELFSLLTEAV